MYYDIFAFALTNGAIFGWIIYGFVLYYSEENNCDQSIEMAFFSAMMFVILFIGYIFFFIYVVALCLLPCVYFMRPDRERRERVPIYIDEEPQQ